MEPTNRSHPISIHVISLCDVCLYIIILHMYRVAKTHRIPKVADHFPQKSH